jgi:hypothetical protein
MLVDEDLHQRVVSGMVSEIAESESSLPCELVTVITKT